MSTFLVTSVVQNHRGHRESPRQFLHRRRVAQQGVKQYLQGMQAKFSSAHKLPLCEYVVGPHRTHYPHEVKRLAPVRIGTTKHGSPVTEMREFKVMHPGTLVKRPTDTKLKASSIGQLVRRAFS